MGPIRREIAALELSGITRVAMGALGDPDVIPLWFGESDIVTPGFIREAAKRALDEGHTF
jgi:aspartate aminotransferase